MSAWRILTVFVSIVVLAAGSSALDASQRRPRAPRSFPTPSPEAPPPTAETSASQAVPVPADEASAIPSETQLGFPIYPTAVYLTSYDAGQGQRYYLFGTDASFREMVRYYALVLDERGNRVFDVPPTHIFEIGRFREELMAFPPGVTIKDYAWNGSAGYLNPTLGSEPARFRTIIQIVPEPPAATNR